MTPAQTRTRGTVHVVAPTLRHGDTLVWPFDEDLVTAAWEAIQAAQITQGINVARIDLPPWWWHATGLQADPEAPQRLDALRTPHGTLVVTRPQDHDTDPTALARQALEAAAPLDAKQMERLDRARDPTLREADVPMGAYVTPQRHDAVLLERLRLGPGRVRSWTAVAPGAGPAEFQRLQDATGAYHAVLLDLENGTRTVALWTGNRPPALGEPAVPVLRRLLRQDGAWRYGVKYQASS